MIPIISWPGAIINPHWLELPLSRTNFHGHKGVRAIEVLLYLELCRLVLLLLRFKPGVIWNLSLNYPFYPFISGQLTGETLAPYKFIKCILDLNTKMLQYVTNAHEGPSYLEADHR